MAEISNKLKIVLIIDIIATLIFMFLYLIIPDIYANMVDPLVFDPYYWRAFGGTLLALGVIMLIVLIRGEMEQIKLVLELGILWCSIILALNIWELIVLPLSPTYTATTWFDSGLLVVIILLNAFVYYNEYMK